MPLQLHLEGTTPRPTPEQTDPADYFNVPVGMKLHKGKLYVADSCHGRIAIVNPGTMAYEGEILPTEEGSRVFFLLLRVAFDHENAMWVSDVDNSQVLQLDEKGKILKRIGSHGSGPSQFRLPNGIAFDADGNMYVADEFNHRVQKLDRNGNYITQIDTGPRTFPQDLAIKNGFLYVTLTWVDQVAKYDLPTLTRRQTFHLTYHQPKPKAIPRGVDVADSGEVVVAATGDNKTIVFNADGSIRATIANKFNPMNTPESMGLPVAVQIGSDIGTIYQVQSSVHVVQKYMLQDNVYQLTACAGHVRNLPFQLSLPSGFSRKESPTDPQLAIADRYNDRIQVYDHEGKHERSVLGSPGHRLLQPSDVLYGSDGNIYVCDSLPGTVNGRITVFTSEWEHRRTITFDATTLPETAGLFFPFHLAMDSQKNLFCVDAIRNAVHKIDPSQGKKLKSYVGPANSQEIKRGLAIDRNDHVYVIDQRLSRILHFNNDLELLGCFGEEGNGIEEMFWPGDLCFSDDGEWLFVADSGNFRLKVYKDERFVENLGSIGVSPQHFFGVLAIKPNGNRKITTCLAYCNAVTDYSYTTEAAKQPVGLPKGAAAAQATPE